ncbi:MAG: glutamate racemase [Cyanobacteria bacterium SZAS LIN-2]|nr:glutamate racemase [Cyanobacteria bacterium SZAS LIN-3]MBS1997624.1 glutamate racemase [Cyanobacteria bacterium SZAS LIN-2]
MIEASETSSHPIGVYDSGVGGLTVLSAIRELLPHENLIYVADSGHLPYGQKSQDFVTERALAVTEYFISKNAKAIAIPCNTATAAAIKELRSRYPHIPFIGIEPAIKPAARMTKSGVIGVLATTGTLVSRTFNELVRREAPNTQVLLKPCPGWVDLVESGKIAGTEVEQLVAEPLKELIDKQADVLVLGCTHFPFLLESIRNFVGLDFPVLETGKPFARQLHFQLDKNHILNQSGEKGSLELKTSGEPDRLRQLTSSLLHMNVAVERLPQAYC